MVGGLGGGGGVHEKAALCSNLPAHDRQAQLCFVL